MVFSLVLATMMLPGVVLFIPQFILFAKLPAFGFQGSQNWVNTFLPLTVPAFTGSAFYIFLLRQFMRGDRKSTRLNSSHANISYAVFCLNKKNIMSSTRR